MVIDKKNRTRRDIVTLGAGIFATIIVRPLAAATDDLQAAINAFASGAKVNTGKVTLDVAPLVENGNSVDIAISVDSPMTEANYVTTIAVFNEKNPQRDVATFRLTPRSGRARVVTRIRLATTQKLVAVASMSDGTYWSQSADVIVTLAACLEGEA
jgi:sulfur-oxidizing protein SoxY